MSLPVPVRHLAFAALTVTAVWWGAGDAPRSAQRDQGGPYPSDWFGLSRAYPFENIPQGAFRAAVGRAIVDRAAAARPPAGLATTSGTLTWVNAGPYNIGGRVTAVVAIPGGATAYLASANGGVFKSVNSGVNWTPIFDDYGAFSVGALALDPSDANVLYVGTGESNSSLDSYDGNGLYRSPDGGQSWQHLGLAATARIGRVAVDPSDPNRIFVAAMGRQFSTGPDRGLYRSEDGGATWTRVLFVNDSTGVTDVVISPAHPETVFCATWERVRRPTYRRAHGPGCGIWRSVDSGSTWTRLQTGLPAPSDNVGRIALGIAASRPSTVYAQITTGASPSYVGLGMYRTLDGGDTWARRDVSGYTDGFGGFAWYFGDVAVDPTDPEKVFAQGQILMRSTDGGAHFSNVTGAAHVDQHGMWIDPANPQRVFLGNDGGFFWSNTGGTGWQKSYDLPISQFYGGAIDPSNPLRLLGGTQDNSNLTTAGSPSAWSLFWVQADGFQCLVDHTNPNVWFAEYQFCSNGVGPYRSTNSGGSFSAPTGISGSNRFNWNTPFVMDPSDHDVLLVGSQKVWKSTNNGQSYGAVSGDLTTNPPSELTYGTISALEISPADSRVYYAGTDDGRVWRSTDAGGSWTDVSAGLPVRYVTRLTADPYDPQAVYVTHSGFTLDEPAAHVHRSPDQGASWVSISGNLPDAPANDLLVDPADPQTLYLATDVGVYATRNLGAGWFPLGQGLPLQTVFDLSLHAGSRTLVAATHGRSQWKLDLGALPVAVETSPPPPGLALSEGLPNPSRGEVRLWLELSRASVVRIEVYDAMGRRVRSLDVGRLDAGRHALAWNGLDDRGRSAAAGVYFLRAATNRAEATRRLVRIE